MDKGKVLKLFFIPVLVGLVVTALVYGYLSRIEAGARKVELVEVVVAVRALPVKTLLTKDMLATKPFPKEYLGRYEVTQLQEAIGKVTTVPLAEGEMVMQTKLATKEAKVGLSYHIPQGKRAVAVKVTEFSGVAGFPEPGDRVDILVTLPPEVVGVQKTRLILEELPVLAKVQRTEVQPGGTPGDLQAYTSLTVAVTPEEALQLALAEQTGQIKMLLRPAVSDGKRGKLEVTTDTYK